MAKHITTWKPDTCDCIIHYEWDDSVPAEERVHTPVESVTTHDGRVIPRHVCAVHAGTIENAGKEVEHHDKIKEENTRKNQVLGHILENSPDLTELVQKEDGSMVKEFKKGLAPEWSFDASRNLKVSLKGNILKKSDKDTLKGAVEATFAKVILE